MNIRLTKREAMLLEQMSRTQKMSKSKLFRKFMIEPILNDEPDYTPDEIEADKKKIEEQLTLINKKILKEIVNLPLAVREGVISKLNQLAEALTKRP
jgi:hypothetical protein